MLCGCVAPGQDLHVGATDPAPVGSHESARHADGTPERQTHRGPQLGHRMTSTPLDRERRLHAGRNS